MDYFVIATRAGNTPKYSNNPGTLSKNTPNSDLVNLVYYRKIEKLKNQKIYFCIVQISGLGKDIHSKGHILRVLRWRIRMIERIYTNSSVARFFLVHSTGSTPKHSCDKHTDSLVVALVSYLLD